MTPDAPFPGNHREYPHKPYIVRIYRVIGLHRRRSLNLTTQYRALHYVHRAVKKYKSGQQNRSGKMVTQSHLQDQLRQDQLRQLDITSLRIRLCRGDTIDSTRARYLWYVDYNRASCPYGRISNKRSFKINYANNSPDLTYGNTAFR